MQFTPTDRGTDVHWVSRFEMQVPVVGGLLARISHRIFGRVFQGALSEAKARLEASSD
jgi:hypothetical protein